MVLDPIILSRIQFALTLSFHILFPTLNIGLAGYLFYWEAAWLKTKKLHYYQLCRFWVKVFAMAFGIGVVSGLVLSYEFGTNFSRFTAATGNVLGPLMSYEVLTAFFLEAGFLGIMLFGWEKVSRSVHLFSSLMVMLGASVSAFWILAANSWMQTPAGYRLDHGIFYVVNWWQVIFNPSFPYRFLHMVIASYLTTSVFIVGISAWHLRNRPQLEFARSAFSVAMAAMLILAPLQILVGDMHGLNTFKYQPMKISAIEARWDTMAGAPLTLFAWPDMKAEKNLYSVEVPKLGSIILRHSLHGEIYGLKTIPKQDRPYVPIVFFSFRVMVGIGFIFLLTAFVGQGLRMRKHLFTNQFFLKWCSLITPLGFIAVLAGWYTTETGRQPWVVYGLLRTQDAASILPASSVLISLIAFAALYSTLLATFIFYVCRLIRQEPHATHLPRNSEQLTAWLEKE